MTSRKKEINVKNLSESIAKSLQNDNFNIANKNTLFFTKQKSKTP